MIRKRFSIDPDSLLKAVLLFALTAAYALVVFTVVDAVVIMPFAEPRKVLLDLPRWVQPLRSHFDLLSAPLSIIFGPTIGITLVAAVLVLLTTPRVYRWLRIGINDLIDGQHDDAFALLENIRPHLETMNAPQTLLPTVVASMAQTLKLPYVAIAAHEGVTPLEAAVGVAPKGRALKNYRCAIRRQRLARYAYRPGVRLNHSRRLTSKF